jgi:hypothetical protein
MAIIEVSAKDRERFARARARGLARLQAPSAIVDARYDTERDAIVLEFRGGGSMILAELDHAPHSSLEAIGVSPAGDALSWRALDVDVYVPGLVERAFGTSLFAAAPGQRGGRRKPKVKATPAKVNGSSGGRPRKRLAA